MTKRHQLPLNFRVFLNANLAKIICLVGFFNAQVLALSETGDEVEAARNLFKSIRELDKSPSTIMIAEPPENRKKGLGFAIYNRLQRATEEINLD